MNHSLFIHDSLTVYIDGFFNFIRVGFPLKHLAQFGDDLGTINLLNIIIKYLYNIVNRY